MVQNATLVDLDKEAETFAYYLIKKRPTTLIKKRYVQAIKHANFEVDNKDQKFLRYVIKHPHQLGLVDSGLAVTKPFSEVRHRLYMMFAILEASTNYTDDFLPKKRSLFYLLFVIYSGARALLKMIAGMVLLWTI